MNPQADVGDMRGVWYIDLWIETHFELFQDRSVETANHVQVSGTTYMHVT